MKRLFLAIIALSIVIVGYAYSVPLSGDDGKVYDKVDEQPQFPGGQLEMYSYLAQNIKYPADAEKNKQQGQVLVNFVVNTDGSISDIKVVKSVCESLDNEAIRIVKTMPKWTPGKQNGKAVNTRYSLPITYRLN